MPDAGAFALAFHGICWKTASIQAYAALSTDISRYLLVDRT